MFYDLYALISHGLKIMLHSITIKFSETGDIIIPAKGITVFVGPNNSGKSLVLKEIEDAFHIHPFPSNLRILKEYEVEWPDIESLNSIIEKSKILSSPNVPLGSLVIGSINPAYGRQETQISEDYLIQSVKSRRDKNWFATQYLRWGVVRLDGRSRFNLTNDQEGGDLLAPATNILSHLFKNDAARLKVRALIKDAFGLNFVIDPTQLGKLRIRLSNEAPPADEQSLNAEAREFYANSTHIKDASDGVQAFTGIIASIRSGEFHTVLVDEPEAFLHPPLARKLGRNLANLASETGGSLMASTHSSEFLMGCIQSSPLVRVVRLEYSNGKSRARVIDAENLSSLLKKPLMRSANVISGLFHDGVVVVESDNDRVFYSEIYHRMSEGQSNHPSLLFINAQNKQTIIDIMGPLREFGVPAAAITDIDILKDGGKTWTEWLKAARVPTSLHIGYGQQRASLAAAFSKYGRDMKSGGGIDQLDSDDKAGAVQFLGNLEDFGIFPVRRGELENWLPNLAVQGKKTEWAIAMLNRLGGDPESLDYVKPADDDVWEFMERVVAWVRNASRSGTA